MTLGEKIKNARSSFGLSQEDLASKLNVSRSAVAKWESDKGIPDIMNLKSISDLFGVSVDYFLNCEAVSDVACLHEDYSLDNYGRGIRKTKKDRLMREKFGDCEVYTLIRELILSKSERVIDYLIGFLTDLPFGTPSLFWAIRNLDKEFYLLVRGSDYYLAMVTDSYYELYPLFEPMTEKRFVLGEYVFTNCGKVKK